MQLISNIRRLLSPYKKSIIRYMRRRKLKNRDFTIISHNCWGSFINQYYGLQYRSPTCGLLISKESYLKFCANLKNYITKKLEFFDFKNSSFAKTYPQPFPVAMLGDVEIGFMHYPTEEEAAKKWYKRAERINWNNIIYKISHRDMFTAEDIEAFASLDLPNKLIFDESFITGENTTSIIIPNITTISGDETPLTLKYFNITQYLNSLKN